MGKLSLEIQYRLLKVLFIFLAAIPVSLLTKMALPIGRLWYAFDPRHRKIALTNMRMAFGNEKTPAEIRKLIKANFVQFARVTLELPSVMNLNKRNVDDYVTFEGSHHLTDAHAAGAGVIILSAHFGNWELMVRSWPLKTGRPCNGIVRTLDWEPMERLQAEIRGATGGKMVDKTEAKTFVIELLEKNELVGILLDQNASWYEGVFVPFFGQLACTNKGMATLALLLNSAVVPAFSFRQPDGRYKIVISKPVPTIRTGDFEKDVLLNTERYTREIEKSIRQAPDHWFWVHRRWRIIDIPDKHKHKLENARAYYEQRGQIAPSNKPQPLL
jgi:KDO2-lipid IV(A) lauroyltransferase